MVNQRLVSILALLGCFFAFGVIALGAYTRLVDAGLGCPDWPGCYGHLSVPMSETAKQLATLRFPNSHLEIYKAWAEMIHRYFVGGLSLFLLSIVGFIFINKTVRSRGNVLFAIGLIALLLYQIMLGRWTVTLKLMPIIVTQHLLGGFLIISTLWLIYLNNKTTTKPIEKTTPVATIKLLPWAIIALFMVLAQISLGAWTSTNYASLSCLDFPFCNNEQELHFQFKEAFKLFSPLGINYEGGVLSNAARQTIQMVHRLGALVVSLYFLILMAICFTQFKLSTKLMKSLYVILGLLIIQLCIGMANIIFKLPLFSAMSHNLVAVLLLLSVLTFTFQLANTNSGIRVASTASSTRGKT